MKSPKRKDNKVEVEEANEEEKSTPITVEGEERKEIPIVREPSPIKAYMLPIPLTSIITKEEGTQVVCQVREGLQEVAHQYSFCKYISINVQLCQISEGNSF